jgi:hypothetical protein
MAAAWLGSVPVIWAGQATAASCSTLSYPGKNLGCRLLGPTRLSSQNIWLDRAASCSATRLSKIGKNLGWKGLLQGIQVNIWAAGWQLLAARPEIIQVKWLNRRQLPAARSQVKQAIIVFSIIAIIFFATANHLYLFKDFDHFLV